MDTSPAPHYPDFETFQKLAAGGAKLAPVYRRLLSDALTPVSAFHKIDAGRCACLFESVVGGEKVGRYSFLATEPFFEIEAYGRRVTTNAYSGISAGGAPTLVTRQFDCENPLDELRRQVEAVRAVHLPELPPFCSGAVGYAGYDTVRYFEHLPNAPTDDRQVPDMAFAFYDQMVVFDNVTKAVVVVAMARGQARHTAAQAYQAACGRSTASSSSYPRAVRPGRSYPHAGRCDAPYRSISRSRTSRRRFANASNTSAPATFFRSSSASGWKCLCRRTLSRYTARCAWSTPVRSCSTSARPALRWWAARRK